MFSVDFARSQFAELGPVGFVHAMHRALGLRDANGVKHRNSEGLQVLESRQIRPEAISLRALGIALLGEAQLESALRQAAPVIPGLQGNVLEAGNDIVPSQFANITAFNETVAGLMEVKILEPFSKPEYVASRLAENVPSNKRTEKFIGISGIGDTAQERKPGQPHPRAELSERYVETPVTVNRGNGIDVTREAILFDQTQQLLSQAESAGDTLALNKEYRIIDTFIGIDNTYKYNGTSYYTYVASGGNWVNVMNNDLQDWTALDNVFLAFNNMRDQETGQPISLDVRDVFVMPGKLATANKILTDPQVRQGNASNTTTVGTPLGYGRNPISGMWDAPFTSPYAYKRMLDTASASTTAGLMSKIDTQNSYSWTAAQMATYGTSTWFAGNFKKAFGYVENLPLTIVRAAPDSYTMGDRGLLFSLFADEMGAAAVLNPMYVIRNQGFAATTATW